ncbi:uncharacterized protein G2W53_012630 [Senna tora]|uniref:C2 NT-type domain-containing protein n=1 Tax=Senna tora TaxID=362788 RepID=A0A834TXX8_9FABA|nr:uncharacterized protein G2W53_012630 [Senna tora]
MTIKYWTPRLLSKQGEEYEVRLNRIKLELGLFGARVSGKETKTMAIDIAAKSASSKPISRLALPLINRKSKRRCVHTTDPKLLRKAPTLSWDARDLRDFHVAVKDHSDAACDVAFLVLYGEGSDGRSEAKMAVAGKVTMRVTVAEMLVREEMKNGSDHQIHRKLPIELRVNGLCIEATLSVCVSFVKLRNHHDTSRTFTNSVEKIYESSNSPVFDSDDSFKASTTSRGSSHSIYKTSRSNPTIKLETETHLDSVHRSWSNLSWNRSLNGLNFKPNTKRRHTLTSKSSGEWEVKELMSRDGEAKLNTNVFFASFDQRSEQASGESACAVLVTLISHWLHSNQDMPTRPEFDGLITEGSFEWRRLCHSDDANLKLFPDKHFDLETVIEANLRPLSVVPEKSYTGFFSPHKFQSLKGAMSFDEIWDEISRINMVDLEPRIYIVSWNDHFFVLKVEADAYYIIDSLGERLFEGCKEAFILKFDDSSLMYQKMDKAGKSEKERLELVCSGKDCCKEFIKRFLAALPVKQLEEVEKKGSISNPYLHRLLQVDFHYSSSTSSSSSASSLFSSGALEAEVV